MNGVVTEEAAKVSTHQHFSGMPEWAKDCVNTKVVVRFSFRDRLRILFGANYHARFLYFTENIVGRGESSHRVDIAKESTLP